MNSLRGTDPGTAILCLLIACMTAAGLAAAAPFPAPVDTPARGVLLVAHPSLRDPNFAETVVLITDHGILGSVGLVLNRPSATPVVGSIPELEGLEDDDITLRFGGPVGLNSIRLLVRSERPIDNAARLVDSVYFVNSSSLLHELLEDARPRDALKIHYYAGFAAWSPGQLDAEIARGDWLLTRASTALVFAEDDERTWADLVESLAGMWVRRRIEVNGRVNSGIAIVNGVTNQRGTSESVTATAYNRDHKIIAAAP